MYVNVFYQKIYGQISHSHVFILEIDQKKIYQTTYSNPIPYNNNMLNISIQCVLF